MFKVLVVEDNPSDAKLLSFILQRKNYDLHLATDAHQAFDSLSKYPIDLILLDWQLPAITGLDVLKTLRKEDRYKLLPVILVSGKRELKDVQVAIKNGANDYIIKPIDPMILDTKMNRLLKNELDWKLVSLPPDEASKASLNMKIKVQKLSEVGLEVQTDFPLPPGANLEIDLKLLKDLEVPPVQVKVLNCDPSGALFLSKCSLIGLKEADLQKIRLYVRMIQIDKQEKAS